MNSDRQRKASQDEPHGVQRFQAALGGAPVALAGVDAIGIDLSCPPAPEQEEAVVVPVAVLSPGGMNEPLALIVADVGRGSPVRSSTSLTVIEADLPSCSDPIVRGKEG